MILGSASRARTICRGSRVATWGDSRSARFMRSPGDAAWDLRQPSEFLAHIDHIGGRAGGGGYLRRL